MSKGRNIKKPTLPPATQKKYLIRKVIVLAIIIILGLILYIDSQTGFIKSLVGDKTIEIRIKK
jgi:hypothetical protein